VSPASVIIPVSSRSRATASSGALGTRIRPSLATGLAAIRIVARCTGSFDTGRAARAVPAAASARTASTRGMAMRGGVRVVEPTGSSSKTTTAVPVSARIGPNSALKSSTPMVIRSWILICRRPCSTTSGSMTSVEGFSRLSPETSLL
jgi:hypothetical protein